MKNVIFNCLYYIFALPLVFVWDTIRDTIGSLTKPEISYESEGSMWKKLDYSNVPDAEYMLKITLTKHDEVYAKYKQGLFGNWYVDYNHLMFVDY